MRKLLAILQIFVLMAAMALPTAFAAEAPIMLAGLEAASSSSSTEAQHDWDTNLFFQTMQEKTGIAFSFTEYVSREAWTEAKTEMLAGEVAMPDMFFKAELTPQETLAFYEAGKLIDLRPYLAEYTPHVWALLEANPKWMEAVSLPDGAIVALPSINELTPNNTMWINKTWLDRLKMGVPTTAEELTEVLRQFRDRDMNQNGSRNDEIPLSFVSMWDLRFLAHAFGINADDYYGPEAFKVIYEYLSTHQDGAVYDYCMVSYLLKNTVSENGTVSRGVCVVNPDGTLHSVTERTGIETYEGGIRCTSLTGEGTDDLPVEAPVSMNLWGFGKSFLDEADRRFAGWLCENLPKNPLKCEYFLPTVASELIDEGKAAVTVLKSTDKWYGVTYREDKPTVVAAITQKTQEGLYPEDLWA